jgi:pilus assembly protein CpaE
MAETAEGIMTVLIVDDLPETRAILQKLLAFEKDIEVIGTAATGREGLEFAHQFKPDIILMDINMPDMDGITATEEIKKIHPSVGIIITSVQSETEYLRRAMMAGARDFVTKPTSSENLYSVIRRVYSLQAEERFRLSARVPLADTLKKGTTGANGHIIAVYSPQGGVGVTTIATNIAIALLHKTKRILLIDADLQWGDVGVFLNLTSKHSIRDLAEAVTDLDQKLIEDVVASHESGLKVLLAPRNPQDAEQITPTALIAIIQHMAFYYDYVVVDMAKRLDETAFGIMNMAERILMVGTPVLPAIKNIRTVLGMLGALGIAEEKILFVMNRFKSDAQGRASIPLDAIEHNLNQNVIVCIPLDELAFLAAVNQGMPMIDSNSHQPPAANLIQLADIVRRSLDDADVELEAITPPLAKPTSRLSAIWNGFSE